LRAEIKGGSEARGEFEAGGDVGAGCDFGEFEAEEEFEAGGGFAFGGELAIGGESEAEGEFEAEWEFEAAGEFEAGGDLVAGGELEAAIRGFEPAIGESEAGAPPASVMLRAVAVTASPATCRRLGARLAGLAPRVAMLVMGDASARKAIGVPGAPDPEAEEYDAAIAAALAAADLAALAHLDPDRAAELRVTGRAPWQVLAGAAASAADQMGGLRGRLRLQTAPFDVSYLVASWAAGPDAAAALAG
jgi:hypothetical protein